MKFVKKIGHFIKKHKVLVGVSLLILLIVIFIFRPKPTPLPDTQTIKKTDLIQSVSVSGSVDSETAVNITFPISGKLVYVGVKKGDRVTKYQTIASLDERTIEDNITSTVKAYQNQKIQFDIVNDFNGNRGLNDLSLSTSAYRQLSTAINTLNQAQIAVEIQNIAKEQSFIYTPIDGIVTRADAETAGVNITPTTTYTIVDPTQLVFKMDVDEADIGKVTMGQEVKVNLDPFPDTTFTTPVSKVDFVSHTTSNGGNAFTVETKLASDNAHSFRVGMNGNAEIITAEKMNVLTVPLSAITDNNTVYIKVGKRYEKRKITTGLQNDTNAEVLTGLNQRDIVVTQPNKITPQEVLNK